VFSVSCVTSIQVVTTSLFSDDLDFDLDVYIMNFFCLSSNLNAWTVGIQLYVSALYVGHLQVVI